MSASLRELQEWLGAAMMAPLEPETDREAVELRMTASARLSALERLEIYHRAYWARLVEVLGDDYPTVKRALGEEAFAGLAREYIERFPSTGPNLNGYGHRMSEVLRERGLAFLADLAALEWAVVEVVHAKVSPPIALEAIQSIPPERWGDMRFSAGNALRVLELAYPANAYFQAVVDEQSPEFPEAGASCTAIYRHETTVWRWNMTPAMATVLVRLLRGEPLGAALGALAGDTEMAKEALSSLQSWFKEWVTRGFFAAVTVP